MGSDNAPKPKELWPVVFDRATSTTYAAGDWDGSAQFEIPHVACNRVRFVDQAWIQCLVAASDPATLQLLRVGVDQTVAAAISAGQFLNTAVDLSTSTLAEVQTDITLVAAQCKLEVGDRLFIVNTSTTAASGDLEGLIVGVALRDVQF